MLTEQTLQPRLEADPVQPHDLREGQQGIGADGGVGVRLTHRLNSHDNAVHDEATSQFFRYNWSISCVEFREACMSDTLHFVMERYDDEDGIYYVISGEEIALVTDGPTIENALKNLREAVELYFEGDDLPELPQLEVRFQVTEAYA